MDKRKQPAKKGVVGAGAGNSGNKTLEEALRESEERYRQIFEQDRAVKLLIEPDTGKILKANRAAASFYGYPVETLQQLLISDINQLDPAEIATEMQAALLEQRTYFIFPHRLASGEVRQVEVYSSPIDLSGKRVLYSIIHDITERKQVEESLRESEEKNRVLFNNEVYAILIFDLETLKLLDVNDTYCRMYGYSREELLSGMTIHDITAEHQVSDAATQQAINEGTIFIPLRYHRKKDGTVFTVEIVGGPYVWQGRKVMFALIHDITDRISSETERKQTEDALRREKIMLARTENIANIGSWEWDIATDTVTWSDELFRIFQRDPKEGAPSFAEHPTLYLPDDMARLQKAVEAAVADGTPYELELRAIRKDGETRVCMARGIAEKALSGRVVRLFGSLQDITQRKQADAALHENEQRLREVLENSLDASYKRSLVRDTYDYLSPSFTKISGYTPDEMNALPLETVEKLMHPDDSAEVQHVIAESLSNPDAKPYRLVYRFKHKQGHYRWVQDSYTVRRDERGQPVALIGSVSDITERKRAEEALQESEEKYRSVVENANEGICVLQDGLLKFVNRSLAAVAVSSVDEMTNKPFLDYVHPEDRALIIERESQRLSGAKFEAAYAFRALDKKGRTRLVELNVILITWQGRPATLNFLKDITEHKQAEEALRESESQYRLLSEHMTDVVWLMDMNFNTLYNSPSVEKLRGFTLKEITEMPAEKNLTPTSLKLAYEVFLEELAKIQADPCYKLERTLEVEMYRKNGTTFWAETKFSLIRDENNKAVSILCEARDISDRKKADETLRESEEKYRVVVENAQESILVIADGMLKFANRSASELSGYSAEEFNSKSFIEFIHPDDRQIMAELYLRRLKGKDVPKTNTFRVISKQGDIHWMEVTATVITWEGKPATLYFMTDITDRKRLEEEQQRVAKLESVGLLAGGIAHDFNNILTSILGNISLAGMEAAPGSELQNSLEQAEKASQRAKALTVQLLTFSKGGAPVLKLASLMELIKDTAGFALSGSKVKCNFSIPAGLWHAEIDAGQVSQVIHNLVINAQQAMPAGGSIEINAENIALSKAQGLGRGLPLEEGHYVRIAVTDHGIGIPKDHLEKIFDPFFTTKQKGNGMGLAISFSIARQHGGHISVESELGTGSTFYLYLPASSQTSAPKGDKKEAIKPAGKARILVMDDEKGVRDIAGRLLRHIGYKDIEFAEDGAEAIKLYKAAMKAGHPFNVAILDLTIAGGMGGEAAIKKLLKIDPGVKAIVSSGYIDDPAMANHRDHGFSGVVAKPYTIAELRKAVQDVIG
jgi:PAS domain S-box-containing protein